jgi:pyridoxine 5-phosphate synthase
MIKLGVNLDHVATLRNARGENDPVLLECAYEAREGGADQFTIHLREDRRHINESDVEILIANGRLPVNLELSSRPEMLDFAFKYRPTSLCIVPENRSELTTEGGLNLKQLKTSLHSMIPDLIKSEIQVFLFIEPDIETLEIASELKVTGVEIHTGLFSREFNNSYRREANWQNITKAAEFCAQNNLKFHAGHGINYQNIHYFREIENCLELNIGHAIISRAILVGLRKAVEEMKVML